MVDVVSVHGRVPAVLLGTTMLVAACSSQATTDLGGPVNVAGTTSGTFTAGGNASSTGAGGSTPGTVTGVAAGTPAVVATAGSGSLPTAAVGGMGAGGAGPVASAGVAAGGMPSVGGQTTVSMAGSGGTTTNPLEPVVCDASAAPAVGALGIETVVSGGGLDTVSYAVQPPGSSDWYIVEQRGRILVYADGALRSEPFLDLGSEISLDPMYDERGLHSIAFPPDYETSGLFYVVATLTTGARANRDLFLEYRRSDADPYVADPTETRTLLDLEGLPTSGLFDNIHNAYMAQFGPDGMLYLGMGDGGGECNNNPGFQDLPQDIASPYGKLLRFDLTRPEPWGAEDNPFVGMGDERVLHYGLRNPFRFNWDSATGDLYIGDVGQDTHEEVNVALAGSAGLNFGWASWEGDEQVCSGRPLRDGADVTGPIYTTTHGNGGFGDSVVGGVVYRGAALPSLVGTYLFGDWSADHMTALYHCDGTTSASTTVDYVRDLNVPNNGYLTKVGDGVPDIVNLTSITQDAAGEIFLTVNGDTLLKVVPAP